MWILTTFLFLASGPPAEPAQSAREQVTAAYREAFAARRGEALRQLWRENAGLVLITIDADLEASLAAWEGSPDKPPATEIASLQARALWGAQMATQVTGRPIFDDYAAAFVSWNDEEKQRFRAGQKAYRRAVDGLKAGAHAEAFVAARECRETAERLGDWWGAAMGYSAEGSALEAAGRPEEALSAAANARLLYYQFGLSRKEFLHLRSMTKLCMSLERWRRAHVCANAALDLAREFEEADAVREILRQRLEIEIEMHMDDAAAETMKEIEGV